ncbi:Putative MetA-pathway of phenol degradation [Sinomicrobium oceani]|uniref:Putative MetA-pathway of phenol degradation n=1 Tax=Sinomicrobium oceani TaxID=1150368 RepID=A0A1K1RTH3_9FLAO|nr:transporter [Sinomicrobium oceani]SFW75555.1 Putative MetA-pathway of phenol degradation [Sinomicrobium oceani]
MKHLYLTLLIVLLAASAPLYAQYTDIINSNRPGRSVSAYAPGKNVYQGEMGFFYERRKHDGLRTENEQYGTDFALRVGILEERLELTWQGIYMWDNLTYNTSSTPYTVRQNNFYQNTIGAKYLIYEPKIKEPNLYSWRYDHTRFHLSDLIPAVSAYIGTNLFFGDNPFYPDEAPLSLKAMLITQSHFAGSWVLTTNIIFDRLGGDDPLFSYILTLTHSLPDPRYSVFLEHQGFKSDSYGDGIFRFGAARLINSHLQVDASAGLNIKNTPSRLFAGLGVSYRLDYHEDEYVPVPLQEEDKDSLEEETPELIDHKAGRKMKFEKQNRKKKKNKKKKGNRKKNPFDVDL